MVGYTPEQRPTAAEPLAVIGFAFKFPSGIEETESFWQMIVNGSSGLKDIPEDRFNLGAFRETGADETRGEKPKGYFIEGDIAAFDAPFFSITAEEALAMDPQHRILLETSYHAFENAGLPMDQVSNSRTSVHVGCLSQDYRMIGARDIENSAKYAATGQDMSILSNRLSWFFNLKGPSLSVETACSSSLVALDAGCQLLRNGETNMALIAGTSLMHMPDFFVQLDNMGFLSPDNKCHSFDAQANGYARAEGFGVILIKRLSDAVRDGNAIRAVIRASGTNSDGYTPGLTQPNGASQLALIRETYTKANLSMKPTRFCEAHGTGTTIGDPIESQAIGTAFSSARSIEDPIYIGAIKANIGHMEAASGMAGIIKTILVLEHGVIPPIANLTELNPDIDDKYYRLKFPVEARPWPSTGLRRASVNSFGFGGTNSHVIMDDAYNFLRENGLRARHNTRHLPPARLDRGLEICEDTCIKREISESRSATSSKPYLLKVSAADRDGVKRIGASLGDYFKNFGNHPTNESEICRQLATILNNKRTLLPWASYALVSSLDSISSLRDLLSIPRKSFQDPVMAFCFTGQGAQYAQMGVGLMQYSLFAESISRSSKFLTDLGCPWNLEEELYRDAATSRVHNTDIAQPLSTAIQIGLVDLLERIGLKPAIVIGHSSGEVAAAYCKGAICQGSAMKIAYFRGLSGAEASTSPLLNGTMMAVGLGESETTAMIRKLSSRDISDIHIGCINSPTSVTVSGEEYAIDNLKAILDKEGIFARKLKVSCAYHSPHIADVAYKYLPRAISLEPRHESNDIIRMISYLDGKEVSSERLKQIDYWIENMYSPVNFLKSVMEIDRLASLAKGTKKLDLSHRKGALVTNILEIGPHAALRGPLRDIAKQFKSIGTDVQYNSALVRGSPAFDSFLDAVGSLQCAGFDIDTSYLNGESDIQESITLVDLPAYPFAHSRKYWHESRRSQNERFRRQRTSELLGAPTPDSQPYNPTWRNILNESKSEWIKDHSIKQKLVYPAAGMLAMAIEAINRHAQANLNIKPLAFRLKDVEFTNTINIPNENSDLETQIHLRPSGDGSLKASTWFEFSIFSCEDSEWKKHCKGLIQVDTRPCDRDILRSQHHLRSSSDITDINTKEFYDKIWKAGYTYGPAFQGLTQIKYSVPGEIRGQVKTYQNHAADIPKQRGSRMVDQEHIVHPATLDSILQIALPNIIKTSTGSLPTMIPTKIKEMWLSSTGLNSSTNTSLSVTSWIDSCGYRGSEHTVSVTGLQNGAKLQVIGYELTNVADGNATSSTPNITDLHHCWGSDWKVISPIVGQNIDLTSSITVGMQPVIEIHTHEPSIDVIELAETLRSRLQAEGSSNCTIVDSMKQTDFSSAADLRIVLWDTDRESILAQLTENNLRILQRLAKCKNILWLQTSDPKTFEFSSQHIIDGLSRVIRQEEDMKNFATLSVTSRDVANRASAILRVCQALFSETDYSSNPQTFRETCGKEIEALKLKELPSATQAVQSACIRAAPKRVSWDTNRPMKLTVGSLGMLDTLHFTKDDLFTNPLQDNEIEVEVKAVGLNFKDCLIALGGLNESSIGNEISGVVTRIGRDTENHGLIPGHRVCGFATNGYRTFYRNHGQSFAKIPTPLTFTEAASIPINFATAWHSLKYVARLKEGETVLIHSAAGGTGQAAIQISQYLGAQVFATVGTDEKRDLLVKHYGINPEHIFNSRDPGFAAEIHRLTGDGVDVVFNSLSGELLTSSWESIAPFGRFIEIGKKDILARNSLPMAQFEKNCSFCAVDLGHMFQTRPKQVTKLITEVLKLFQEGSLGTVNQVHTFDIGDIVEAFRLMQSGKSSGKIVVETNRSSQVEAILAPEEKSSFVSEASYIIAGGLGGLGRDIARWMASRGAKHLVLLSRSGPQSEAARNLISEMRNKGVICYTPRCDITNHCELEAILEDLTKTAPSIKGCIQASMVLRSALFSDMTHSEWSEATRSKISGSWNLHTLLPKTMDFFLFLSSVQSIIGSRTQGNYAAANSYLDALAQHRVSLGLKAVSLQLGLMDSDGYLSEHQDQKQLMLAQNTYLPISRLDFHSLLDYYCSGSLPLLQPDTAQVAIGLRLLHTNPDLDPLGTSWGKSSLFEELRRINAVSEAKTNGTSPFSIAKSTEEAINIAVKALTQRIASTIAGMDPEEIDVGKAVQSYGVDSLQTMELRSWFMKAFSSDVATFEILGASSLSALAQTVVERSLIRLKC